MAEGLNKVMLLGNLGQDPELKMLPSGQAVMRLRLATTERRQDKAGTWVDHTEWHSVTVWGKRAEALSRILSKGSTIFVEGKLRTSSYEKNGEKRYSTEVTADNIILSGGRRSEGASDAPRSSGGSYGGGASGGGGGGSRPAPAAEPAFDTFGGGEDDIPF
jgi:single-strand DNA-binding protein